MSTIRVAWFKRWVAVGIAAAAWGGSACGAQVDPASFQSMQSTATRDGVVCVVGVLVSDFPGSLGLFDINADTPEANAARAKHALLLEKLGAEIWKVGRKPGFSNMFGGYVTTKGLDILLASPLVRGFGSECSWQRDALHLSGNGQLDTVEAELQRQKYVDVEFTIDVEGLNLDLLKDGRVKYIETPGARQDFIAKATGLLTALSPEQLLESSAAQRKLLKAADPATLFDPRLTVRLSRMGVVGIAPDRRLRRLVPAGYVANTDRWVDPQLLVDARQHGQAYVNVGTSYAYACSCYSNASYRADGESRVRALREILAKANLLEYANIDSAGWSYPMSLTLAQLERLIAVKDDRLVLIRGSYPASSAGSLNAAQGSSAGTLPTPAPLAPIIISGLQVASDTIFDWAERLPNSPVGRSSGVSHSALGYRFRYYPDSNSYLGVSETYQPRVVYAGPASNDKALDLGPMTDWLDQAAPIQNQ